MRFYGLFRKYQYDHSKNIHDPDKQLGTVISENINTKSIDFVFSIKP